jgi:hypothetical protein
MADPAATEPQQSPESRLLGAGFSRRLEWWVPPGEDRALSLEDAVAALDAGEVKPVGLEIRALSDQPGFRELTAEAVDAMADRLFRPPPPPPPDWLEPLAELVAQRLKPVVRAEVRSAMRAEARRQTRERTT